MTSWEELRSCYNDDSGNDAQCMLNAHSMLATVRQGTVLEAWPIDKRLIVTPLLFVCVCVRPVIEPAQNYIRWQTSPTADDSDIRQHACVPLHHYSWKAARVCSNIEFLSSPIFTKMPAPTALLKPIESAPENVPLPDPDQDDELLVDVQGVDPTDASIVAPLTTSEDTEMAIDEEGRPRFAKGQDVVRAQSKALAGSCLMRSVSCRTLLDEPRRERSPSLRIA
jgi:hypothetical protein